MSDDDQLSSQEVIQEKLADVITSLLAIIIEYVENYQKKQ